MGESVMMIVKFIFSIIILPIVFASAVVFQEHLSVYSSYHHDMFMSGFFTFMIVFLFFNQCWGIYEFGQKLVQGALRFTSPADRILSQFLPFYFIAWSLLAYVLIHFLDASSLKKTYVMLAGGFAALHIFLTSADFQEHEKTFVKPNYMCLFSTTFIICTFVFVLFLDFVEGRFTFSRFFSDLVTQSKSNYNLLFSRFL